MQHFLLSQYTIWYTIKWSSVSLIFINTAIGEINLIIIAKQDTRFISRKWIKVVLFYFLLFFPDNDIHNYCTFWIWLYNVSNCALSLKKNDEFEQMCDL